MPGSVGTGGWKGKTLLNPVFRRSPAARAARARSAANGPRRGGRQRCFNRRLQGTTGKSSGDEGRVMNEPLGKTDEPKLPRAPALVDYESCSSGDGSSERWRCLKEQLVHWGVQN